jgi:hypothetical protein
MSRHRHAPVLAGAVLTATLLLAAGVSTEAARPESIASTDAYGYTALGAPDCGFDFIDLSTGGTVLAFAPSGYAPADDDGAAVLPLERPFEFYGRTVDTLIVSTNGYVAAAGALSFESGGDFSNDAVVPAIPDNAPGTPARMLVYHDDLSGLPTGGQVLTEYFENCPRPSETFGSEACTVIEWSGWSDTAGRDPFDAQVVLYHESLLIVFQWRPGAAPLAGGTVGIQDGNALSGSRYAAPVDTIVGDAALCWLEPRFPAGGAVADLALTNTDKTDSVPRDRPVIYSVSVVNRGPSPVADATVENLLPASLVDCVWFCSASPDSGCTKSGQQDILDHASIAVGGWLDYRLICRTTADPAVLEIATAAEVRLNGDVLDPVPANNTDVDVDQVTDTIPGCPAPLIAAVAGTSFDPMDPPSTLTGLTDAEGDPLLLGIRRVFVLEPQVTAASGQCTPPGTGRLRLGRDGRPAPDPIYQIEFTLERRRGGICSAIASVRGTTARGRFGEVPTSSERCALP